MSDIVNISIEVQNQPSITISTVGTQGPVGDGVTAADLLSALETLGADLPQEDPDEPEKWWVEPPGGIFRYTGTDVEIGTSFIGNSWIA